MSRGNHEDEDIPVVYPDAKDDAWCCLLVGLFLLGVCAIGYLLVKFSVYGISEKF